MVFLKKFSHKINEDADQMHNVQLPNGILLSDDNRKHINEIMRSALIRYFPNGKANPKELVINGKTINTEYIWKAINNRMLLVRLVINNNIKNEDSLIKFISENLFKLFNPNGEFFDLVYRLLQNTSKKGERAEGKAYDIFIKAFRTKTGDYIKIDKPDLKTDISGIDGTFSYKGKTYTMQIKPLYQVIKKGGIYFVYVDGILKNLISDYLVVLNAKECYIFRSKGSFISPNGNYFIMPGANFTYNETIS